MWNPRTAFYKHMLYIGEAHLRGFRGVFVLFSLSLLIRKSNTDIYAMRKQFGVTTDNRPSFKLLNYLQLT